MESARVYPPKEAGGKILIPSAKSEKPGKAMPPDGEKRRKR